ncbi:hypothetical protein [Pseudoalteromonas phenolica]|uniref:YobI family P-loop NTPase n=1 Tax=Pseudoalteromonas phenolica TaxID=161398 RepID=UPI0038512007
MHIIKSIKSGAKFVKKTFKSGVIKACWSILQCFERPALTNSAKIPDLCPTDDAKFVDSYIDMLNESLLNREQSVKEIALTSPYSGGKSSFINTYIRKTPFLKFTSISLASFKDLSQNIGVDSPEDNTATLVGANGNGVKFESTQRENLSKIEKSIVQQLLYRTNSEDTPNSRFRRIFPHPVSSFDAISIAAATVFWASILGSMIYLPDFKLAKLVNSVLSSPTCLNIHLWILSYFVSLPMLVVRDLYKNLSGYSLSKFNPTKGELAFEQQKKDSIFNIYLDEIIYFFSSQKTDVVIFEDLDRFENVEVFIKLKELNKLINDSKDVTQKVRFIYALRDDVFQGKDRTKFFDVIIPIIPIASKANSYPQIKELMTQAGLLNDVNDSFLRGVSVYVDDMRMLKNIVTEFVIYKNTLTKNLQHLDLTKLFAFIIYKNVYCDDFALLHSEQGLLSSFFLDIGEIRNNRETALKAEIEEIKQRILDSERELTASLEELNSNYVINLLEKFPKNSGVWEVSGYRVYTIHKADIFDTLLNDSSRLTFRSSPQHQNSSTNFTFSQFLDELSPDYKERKQRIIDKSELGKQALSKKIEQLTEELAVVNDLSLAGIIETCPREEVFKNIEDKPLLILLLERGYIDQHYNEYISHFHEGHTTLNDMAFIRCVQGNKELDPDRVLDNYQEVLKYFSDEDYKKSAFFNYKLFDEILKGKDKYPIYRFIENNIAQSQNGVILVRDGLKNLKNKEAWIRAVVSKYRGFWDDLVKEQSLIQKEKHHLLLHAFNALPSKNINAYVKNAIESLNNYLNENESIGKSFLDLDLDEAKLVNLFSALDVKFQHLSYIENENDFLSLVLKFRLFEVTESNISVIAKSLFDLADNSKDFSDLIKIEENEFKKFFNDNIEEIASFVASNRLTVSKSDDYIWLLNCKDIKQDTCKKIIETNSFNIDDIKTLSNRYELSKDLLKHQRIVPNWNNTLYLEENDTITDKEFKSFLNDNSKALCSEKEPMLSNEYAKSFAHMILDDIIELKVFADYLTFLNYQYSYTDIEEIPSQKLTYLIENKLLPSDINTFEAISHVNFEQTVKYLLNNFESFISGGDLIDELQINSELFYELLKSNEFHAKNKKVLVESRSELLSFSDNEEILKFLFGYKDVIQDKDIDYLNIPKLPLGFLKNTILESDDDFKKILLASQLQYLDDDEVVNILTISKIDFSNAFTPKRSFKVAKNNINIIFATKLEERGLISSFKDYKRKSNSDGNEQLEIFVKKSVTSKYLIDNT